MVSFRSKIDGRDYPIEQLDKIINEIATKASEIFQIMQSFDLEEKKKAYYIQKAYSYKWLYQRLGQDWRPSEEIFAEAANKTLFDPGWPQDLEEQKQKCRRILDPRIVEK